MISLRYAQDGISARSRFMKLCGKLQGTKIVTLNSNPEACARVLASSNKKGQGIELMVACPAWKPVYSIESVDDERWEWLSTEFSQLYAKLDWQPKVEPIAKKHIQALAERARLDSKFLFDSEQVSRLSAQILFEITFDRPMSEEENTLFYQASIEWRKEIAIKGKASAEIKAQFWQKLGEIIESSRFAPELEANRHQRDMFLSLFAQPLIISPQINFADIMSAVFGQFRKDRALFAKAKEAAVKGDLEYLQFVCMEAIRLNHPFPVLERELTRKLKVADQELEAGTQVYIMFDEFVQEQKFVPERWEKSAKNPYRSMPFGTGQRMCLGRLLATEMFGEMLGGMLKEIPLAQLRPDANHLYSGRNNDGKDSLATIAYQLSVFSNALKQSFQIGRAKKKEAVAETQRVARCPFTGRTRTGSI